MNRKANTARLTAIFSSFLLFFLLLLALSATGTTKKAWACRAEGAPCYPAGGADWGCCTGTCVGYVTSPITLGTCSAASPAGGGSSVETAVVNPLSRFGSLREIFGFAVNLLIGVG